MIIMLANAEVTGHKRLIDLGLEDGDILEVETINSVEQTAITIDRRVSIPGTEQYYANQRQNKRKDEEQITRSIRDLD